MDTEYWFLVRIDSGGLLHYLTKAETPAIAKSRCMIKNQNAIANKINWSTMKKITGCVIPLGTRSLDFATGAVSFELSGHVVTMV